MKGLSRVKVTAQYWCVIDSGALVFRNRVPNGGYPETVRLFAAGHWLEVIPHKVER
jgi:hypothetical protein